MKPIMDVTAVRDAEAAFMCANPEIDLMARASDAIVAQVRAMTGPNTRVIVVVGPGNNGGDGLFAAAGLAKAGHDVALWLVMHTAHAAGLRAAEDAGARRVTSADALTQLPHVDLVIDALAGIGGRPGLPEDVRTFAAACASTNVAVLSLDIPSGLDADSHETHPSFQATNTLTFIALKRCHVEEPAASSCGDVRLVDIGVAPSAQAQVVEPDDLRSWPVPGPSDDKYSRGVVGIDTGSKRFPGAGVLSVAGASHSGAGMVRYLGPARDLVLAHVPSVVCEDGRVQALLVGSGWGHHDADRFAAAAERGVPLVIDAEALIDLPTVLPAGSVLTPHAGELARILDCGRGDVLRDPRGAAREAAARYLSTVLLKGATDYVASPDGEITIAHRGPSWSAVAGSGDVLAGVVASLLAQGVPSVQAAAWAASLQSVTAATHLGPYPPHVVASQLAHMIGALTRGR